MGGNTRECVRTAASHKVLDWHKSDRPLLLLRRRHRRREVILLKKDVLENWLGGDLEVLVGWMLRVRITEAIGGTTLTRIAAGRRTFTETVVGLHRAAARALES